MYNLNELDEMIISAVKESMQNKQQAKADAGKPKLTLVPRKILFDIARVREYGNRKYGSSENWKQVEPERSGLPHLWHLACNIAFLCEMEGAEQRGTA